MGNERNSDKASCWPRAYIQQRRGPLFAGIVAKPLFRAESTKVTSREQADARGLGQTFRGNRVIWRWLLAYPLATQFSNRIIFHLLNLTGTFRNKNISKNNLPINPFLISINYSKTRQVRNLSGIEWNVRNTFERGK